MEREQYQVPTSFSVGAGTAGSGPSGGYEKSFAPTLKYKCGDCANDVQLEKSSTGQTSAVRCFHCGGRVLYKERTRRMVQFEAR